MLSQSSADSFYVLNYQREQILTAYDLLSIITSRTITLVEAIYDNAYNLLTIRWVEGAVSRCSCAEPLLFERNKDTFS